MSLLLVENVRYYSNSSWTARSVALFSGPWCHTRPEAQPSVWGATAACHFVAGVVWSTVATAQQVPSPKTETALWKRTLTMMHHYVPFHWCVCQTVSNLTHAVQGSKALAHDKQYHNWFDRVLQVVIYVLSFKPCALGDPKNVCEHTIPKITPLALFKFVTSLSSTCFAQWVARYMCDGYSGGVFRAYPLSDLPASSPLAAKCTPFGRKDSKPITIQG